MRAGRKVCMLIFLCLFLTGCGQKEDCKPVEKETLILWHYWDIQKNQALLEELVRDFNSTREDFKIEAVFVPDEDFKKQLALSMAEEKMPDIALVDSSDFRYLHSMRPFVELTGKIPELEEYLPEAMASCTMEKSVYGQPFGMNCTALFYNKILLERAGLRAPATWEEFRSAAAALSQNNVSGFAITALQTEESMYEFLPLLWSNGGDIASVNSRESREAFSLLGEMAEEGSLSRQSISLTMGDLTSQFCKGNLAMMFNSSMAVDTIRETAPELDFGVVPIPAPASGEGDGQEKAEPDRSRRQEATGQTGGQKPPATVVGGEILAVSQNGREDKAIEFLKFLADKEKMQDYMDEFGFLAPRADIMTQQFPEDEEKRAFVGMLQTARIREQSAQWPWISLKLADALSRVIVGEEDTQEILDQTAQEILQIRGAGK